jgi:predicted nucleic acid-binding protein
MASITIREIDERLKARLRVQAAHRGHSMQEEARETCSLRRCARFLEPLSWIDAMIVAMTRSRGACLATRNVKDFENCGVELVNPWTA